MRTVNPIDCGQQAEATEEKKQPRLRTQTRKRGALRIKPFREEA
jgi:hypothetical protein